MREGLFVRLSTGPIEASEALACVADPASGGVVLFAGTVRDHSDAGEVSGMDYEAWEERAVARLMVVGEEMLDRWPVRRVVLWHRFGHLDVGEVSVVVCCSSAHRGEAFEAARHGIERIKHDVPIWKKESLVSGTAHWVMGS